MYVQVQEIGKFLNPESEREYTRTGHQGSPCLCSMVMRTEISQSPLAIPGICLSPRIQSLANRDGAAIAPVAEIRDRTGRTIGHNLSKPCMDRRVTGNTFL